MRRLRIVMRMRRTNMRRLLQRSYHHAYTIYSMSSTIRIMLCMLRIALCVAYASLCVLHLLHAHAAHKLRVFCAKNKGFSYALKLVHSTHILHIAHTATPGVT
jgi:hypothetical protein